MEKLEEPEVRGIKELERGGMGKKWGGHSGSEVLLKEESTERQQKDEKLKRSSEWSKLWIDIKTEVKLGVPNIGFACLLIHVMGPKDHISSLNFEYCIISDCDFTSCSASNDKAV